ncbi:hypothetical protein AB0M43_15910 [Longispora sp. NPDC051575]|uniref:hypothetical protein n=1 Tax=Longispora sp. NPDC051575 TaxID=3154943 RepID=UPI0034271FFD
MFRVIMEEPRNPWPAQVTRVVDRAELSDAMRLFHEWRSENPYAVGAGELRVKVVEVDG